MTSGLSCINLLTVVIIFRIKIYKGVAPYGPKQGRLATVDLLVLTSLNQLILILKIFTYITKQATSVSRSTVLSLPLQAATFK
jgi:hypothetical protein